MPKRQSTQCSLKEGEHGPSPRRSGLCRVTSSQTGQRGTGKEKSHFTVGTPDGLDLSHMLKVNINSDKPSS